MSFFKSLWKGNSKHIKLYDEWALASSNDAESMAESPAEEVTFEVKYLGSTLVEKPSSEAATAEAVSTVLSMVKASSKKLPRVDLHVSLTGIKIVDRTTEEIHLNISIYRISYCSADAAHSHVFAFIATNPNETLECHVFLSNKRKMAQTMSLTVAQYFNTAYEIWQLSQDRMLHQENNIKNRTSLIEEQLQASPAESKTLLIDLNSDTNKNLKAWESFEDEPIGNYHNRFEEDSGFSPLTFGHSQTMWGVSPRSENTRAKPWCS